MKRTNKKAFTIVELIVVIVIIGVLAAILIPNIAKWIEQAKYTKDVALITNINKILAVEEIFEESPNDAIELESILESHGLNLETTSTGNYIFYDKESGKVVLASLNEEGIDIKFSAQAANETKGKYLSEILAPEEFIDGYLFVTTKSQDGFADAVCGIREGQLEKYDDLVNTHNEVSPAFDYLLSTTVFITENSEHKTTDTGTKTNVVISRFAGRDEEHKLEIESTPLVFEKSSVSTQITVNSLKDSDHYYVKRLDTNEYVEYSGDFYLRRYDVNAVHQNYHKISYNNGIFWSYGNNISDIFNYYFGNINGIDLYKCNSYDEYYAAEVYADIDENKVLVESDFFNQNGEYTHDDFSISLYQKTSSNIKVIDLPSNVKYLTDDTVSYLANLNDTIITYKNEKLVTAINETESEDKSILINKLVPSNSRKLSIVTIKYYNRNANGELINNNVSINQSLISDGKVYLDNESRNIIGHNGLGYWSFESYAFNGETVTSIDVNSSTIEVNRIFSENSNSSQMVLYRDEYYLFCDMVYLLNCSFVSSGNVVIIGTDNILNENLTVPEKVEIIIPFDNTNTSYITNHGGLNDRIFYETTTIDPYSKLVINNDVQVLNHGIISVGGQVATTYNGSNTGNMISYLHGSYGLLEINGRIVSDGTISSYGIINGEGEINAIDGIINSVITLEDWRGGTNAKETINNNVAPFDNWTLNNIRVKTIFASTAKMIAVGALEASGSTYEITIPLIGNSGNSLFEISDESYITVEYDKNKYGIRITTDGNITDNSISFNVAGYSVSLEKIPFPISNIDIIVHSGELSLSNSMYKILPGSKIEIRQSATLIIQNNFGVYETFVRTPIGNATIDSASYPKPQSTPNYNNQPMYQDRNSGELIVYGSLTIRNNAKFSGYINLKKGSHLKIDEGVQLSTSMPEGYGTGGACSSSYNSFQLITRYTYIDMYSQENEISAKVLLTSSSEIVDTSESHVMSNALYDQEYDFIQIKAISEIDFIKQDDILTIDNFNNSLHNYEFSFLNN